MGWHPKGVLWCDGVKTPGGSIQSKPSKTVEDSDSDVDELPKKTSQGRSGGKHNWTQRIK